MHGGTAAVVEEQFAILHDGRPSLRVDAATVVAAFVAELQKRRAGLHALPLDGVVAPREFDIDDAPRAEVIHHDVAEIEIRIREDGERISLCGAAFIQRAAQDDAAALPMQEVVALQTRDKALAEIHFGEPEILAAAGVKEGVVVRVALLRAKAEHLLRGAPVQAIGAESHARFPEADVMHELVAAGWVGVVQVFENTHVRTVASHDVVHAAARELVQAESGLLPFQSVLRCGVEQIPADIMNRARPIHLRDDVLVGEHVLVPHLPQPGLGIPGDVRVVVVRGILPRLIRWQQRILRRLLRGAEHEPRVLGLLNDSRVEHEQFVVLRWDKNWLSGVESSGDEKKKGGAHCH